jgi:hypothetical protein
VALDSLDLTRVPPLVPAPDEKPLVEIRLAKKGGGTQLSAVEARLSRIRLLADSSRARARGASTLERGVTRSGAEAFPSAPSTIESIDRTTDASGSGSGPTDSLSALSWRNAMSFADASSARAR